MDTWKFYDITHREHDICNPTSDEKLGQLINLLRLNQNEPVLDIACGKGEFLIRLAAKYGVSGLGIDISPYFLEEARQRQKKRAPFTDITFVQMDGAAFKPDTAQRFRLASCLGASWVFGGYKGTLSALAAMVEPGGWVISGEPYWLQDPSADYLTAIGCERDAFGTHLENAQAGEKAGLRLVYTVVSNQDDFDRYDCLQWYAADNYRSAYPDDPDVSELIGRVAKEKERYLRWGRDTLGWAIYVFRCSGAELNIRRMSESESRAVVEVWHTTKKNAYPYLPSEQARTIEEDSRFFHEKILLGCEIWVAEEKGRLVGFIAIHGSYLDRLYVLPNVQRVGVGAALIRHAMRLSPTGLELHTHQKNAVARYFYEKLGFVAVRFGVSPPPESELDVEYHWRPGV